MSRYHQREQELRDAAVEGAHDKRMDELERAEAQQVADEREPLRPCVACGELTRRRWCSTSCFRAEDGWDGDE